jgi:D-alanyl-D-alanine carboxypeptidase
MGKVARFSNSPLKTLSVIIILALVSFSAHPAEIASGGSDVSEYDYFFSSPSAKVTPPQPQVKAAPQQIDPKYIYPPPGQMQPPPELRDCLTVLTVQYYNSDYNNNLISGEIVVNKAIKQNVQKMFEIFRRYHYSLTSVIPVNDPKIHWDDTLSMKMDNSSSYNYRVKTGTRDQLSLHAVGRAVDINTKCNPYVNTSRDGLPHFQPEGATYDTGRLCTFSRDTERGRLILDALTKEAGFQWGGDWGNPKDYQHFEIPGAGGQHPTAPYCR